MLHQLELWLAAMPLPLAGAIASLAAGLAAGVGALPVLVIDRTSLRLRDVLLGAAAGVMLSATCFSLVLPGLDAAGEQAGEGLGAIALVSTAMLLGAVGLWAIHRVVPHEHMLKGRDDVSGASLRRIWLFVLAITLHNVPEGLAVGVGVASGNVADGLALTIGIFLQNLPEGFVVALAVLPLGYSRLAAVGIALLTGAVETLGGLIGAGAVTLSQAFLPWAMAGAAGAMLFVISHEVIPETHRNGHDTAATFGVVVGFVVMMALDVGLGVIAA